MKVVHHLNRGEEGYILVELLVVISILMLFLGRATFSQSEEMQYRRELQISAQQIVGELRRVQQESMYGYIKGDRGKTRILFDGNTFSLRKNGKTYESYNLPQHIINMSGNKEIAFHGTGKTTDDTIVTIRHTKVPYGAQIVIALQTGRIRWYEFKLYENEK